jgi:hypothetical protein
MVESFYGLASSQLPNTTVKQSAVPTHYPTLNPTSLPTNPPKPVFDPSEFKTLTVAGQSNASSAIFDLTSSPTPAPAPPGYQLIEQNVQIAVVVGTAVFQVRMLVGI